jgi:hypothetical protein
MAGIGVILVMFMRPLVPNTYEQEMLGGFGEIQKPFPETRTP